MGNSGKVTAVCLQVRIESTRLPGKALIDIEGKSVIGHAMGALKLVPADHHLLLTEEKSAPELKRPAERGGFTIFVGPEEDVLERYLLAAREYDIDTVIRATGDNPLVSPNLARDILDSHRTLGADYSGFLGMPLGLGVEVISRRALEAAGRETGEWFHREHVCPYLYENPDRFVVNRPRVSGKYLLEEGRVTLDTEGDLSLIRKIFRDLYRGRPLEAEEVVRWLKEYSPAVCHHPA
ncbi:MAG: cytidylyltransferase domain-containing protein [Spirochaetota bacterium]